MSAPAAIRATFAQYAMVKTRGMLVLHLEVPLEQQAEVFAALGYPLPGQETWVAVARLNPGAGAEADGRPHAATTPALEGSSPSAGSQRSEQGKARYAEADDMAKAVTRAALLARDARFQGWLSQNIDPPRYLNEASAAEEIRAICGVSSRSEIGTKKDAYQRFVQLETDFLISTGQMAGPR